LSIVAKPMPCQEGGSVTEAGGIYGFIGALAAAFGGATREWNEITWTRLSQSGGEFVSGIDGYVVRAKPRLLDLTFGGAQIISFRPTKAIAHLMNDSACR
jgi:hypothetical protein